MGQRNRQGGAFDPGPEPAAAAAIAIVLLTGMPMVVLRRRDNAMEDIGEARASQSRRYDGTEGERLLDGFGPHRQTSTRGRSTPVWAG